MGCLMSGSPADSGHTSTHDRRLDTLLNQLQGNGPKIGAAAGLARLQQERLRSIRHITQARSHDCLQGLQSLTRLLAAALTQPDAPNRLQELSGTAEHLAQLTTDLECWLELAENAGFYAERRDVAETITQLWARSAHALGELPSLTPANPR